MSTILGQGRLVVVSASAPDSARQFGFQVSGETIRFYDLAGGAAVSGLEWWSQVQSDLLAPGAGDELVSVPGHAVLSALPATPEAAFFEIAVGSSNGNSSFSLNIRQPNVFGKTQGGQGEFRNLNIVFTQTAAGVTVSGSVELLLFGASTPSALLVPVLSDQGLLTFKTSEGQVLIEAVGSLSGAEVKTEAEPHPWEQLQLVYSFEAGSQIIEDKIIQNSTDKGPLALTLETPEHTTQAGKGLEVTAAKTTGIATAPIDSDSPLPGDRPIARLIQACRAEDKISVVLWVKPNKLNQTGPARILTLSTDHNERNLMVGQLGKRYVARLRTFDAERPAHEKKRRGDRNGRLDDKEPLTSKNVEVQQELTCLALTYTKATDGRDRNVHLYVNGQRADSLHMKGDLQSWENFELAIANEFRNKDERNDRHWSGIFYRLEIYSQALTESQVRQLYYPKLTTTVGDLAFENLPKPLNQPISQASLTYEDDHSLLTATVTTPRQVTPQLQFDEIQLAWKKQQGPWALEPNSQVKATLWQQNSLTLVTKSDTPPSEFLPLVLEESQTFQLEGLGELTITDFELHPGNVNDRPQWQLSATVEDPHLTLPPPGRDFDFQLDFRLLAPQLLIAETNDIGDVPTPATGDSSTPPIVDRVLIQGQWLGKTLGFYGVSLAEGFLLRATTRFDLPFSLTLGPIYRPGSTTKLAERVTMCPQPGCRQTMALNTRVELDATGFVATVNGEFVWKDGHGPDETVQVPEFTTFELPIRPSDLLNRAITQLERHQDEIFTPLLRSRRDFYVTAGPTNGSLLAVYGSRLDLGATVETRMPINSGISLTAVDFNPNDGANNQLVLKPLTEGGATLSITLRNLSTLAVDHQNFLQQVSTQSGIDAAGFITLRQRLAERLPVPLDKALRYAYGYSDGRAIDLVGGMRLRVEYQNYQFVHPLDKTAESGFISSGTAHYALHFNQTENYLGFDPFVTALGGSGSGNTVAGLVDLLQTGLRRPHYRLLYPDQFAPVEGRIGSERAAVLIGADTYARLEEATKDYLDSQTLNAAADVSVVYFRGRAVVVPEIAIFVQDQPTYVAVGTTLKQMAERFGATELQGRPQRLIHEDVENRTVYRFINLDSAPQALELPVVQGDRLYF